MQRHVAIVQMASYGGLSCGQNTTATTQMIKKHKINHPLYTFPSLEAKKRKLQDDVDQLLTGTYVC